MLDFKANGEAGMLFPINGAADSRDTTYRLGRLEVYNWGPFHGLHRADFDSIGTAIIGPTGSGKTTLVDALMTLLVAHPRYNLASTGGHESDRTLPSYIRGELGGDGGRSRPDRCPCSAPRIPSAWKVYFKNSLQEELQPQAATAKN